GPCSVAIPLDPPVMVAVPADAPCGIFSVLGVTVKIPVCELASATATPPGPAGPDKPTSIVAVSPIPTPGTPACEIRICGPGKRVVAWKTTGVRPDTVAVTVGLA